MELNARIQELLDQLGHAVNDALQNNSTIQDAVEAIRAEKLEVVMLLEATISLRQIEDKNDDQVNYPINIDLNFSDSDRDFLRSLDISLESSDDDQEPSEDD